VVKLLKLFAASAIIDGRATVNDGDFLSSSTCGTASIKCLCWPMWWDRCWTQVPIAEHPDERRSGATASDLDGILRELGVIRGLLLGGEPLSDVQLFRSCATCKRFGRALQALGTDTAKQMAGEVDKLWKGCSNRASGPDETTNRDGIASATNTTLPHRSLFASGAHFPPSAAGGPGRRGPPRRACWASC